MKSIIRMMVLFVSTLALSSNFATASGVAKSADGAVNSGFASCATMQQSVDGGFIKLADSKYDRNKQGDDSVGHGTWHPCANDANACGSGHVCCGGHCFKGATCQ